jgi:hypothetical protein
MLFVVSCGNDNPGNADKATLVVTLTDAPFPYESVDYVNVTINKIEIKSVDAGIGSPFMTMSEKVQTFNLIELQNGVTAELVEMDLPVGDYDLIRFYVQKAEIKVKDNPVPFDLDIPSGVQTGIQALVSPPIEVVSGISAELLLDFDISKSFMVMGNPETPAQINGFKFQPVVRGINMTTAGRVSGFVKDASGAVVQGAEVWVKQDSVETTSGSDATGAYALIALPAGIYTAYATKADHDTVAIQNVEVVAGNESKHDFTLSALE